MKQSNLLKLSVFFISFFLLFSAFQFSFQGQTASQNGELNEQKTNTNTQEPQPTPAFNVTPGTELVYNVTNLLSLNQSYFNVTTFDETSQEDRDVGQFVENKPFIVRVDQPTYHPDSNDVSGFLGSMRGQTFWQEFRFNISYMPMNETINNTNGDGPQLIYFVIPAGINFTEAETEFADAGYNTTSNLASTFSVEYKNDTMELNVTWNKTSGVMMNYYFDFINPNNATENFTFGLELLLEFNPGKYIPAPGFPYSDPVLFYEFTNINIGGNTTLPVGSDDPTSMDWGYFEEGQIAQVSLHVSSDMNQGPSYSGEMESLTGYTEIGNPFGDGDPNQCPQDDPNCQPPPFSKTNQEGPPPEDNGPGGPPFLIFMFPVSEDEAWFTDFAIYLEADQKDLKVINEAELYTLFLQDEMNPNFNVSVTFNKSTGVMTHYEMNFEMRDPQNNIYPYVLELNLYSEYDFGSITFEFGVNEGDQFEYLLDVVSFNGTNQIPMEENENSTGYFEEGQALHIRFDTLSFEEGPFVQMTIQTLTGMQKTIIYDFFDEGDEGDEGDEEGGPMFFVPLLPIDADSVIFDMLGDSFGEVFGFNVSNDGLYFSIGFTMNFFDIIEYNVFVEWDMGTGLLETYEYEMYNLTDDTVILALALSYVGTSTGDVYVPPQDSSSGSLSSSSVNSTDDNSSTGLTSDGPGVETTPGFTFLFFLAGLTFVTPVLIRRRKH